MYCHYGSSLVRSVYIFSSRPTCTTPPPDLHVEVTDRRAVDSQPGTRPAAGAAVFVDAAVAGCSTAPAQQEPSSSKRIQKKSR